MRKQNQGVKQRVKILISFVLLLCFGGSMIGGCTKLPPDTAESNPANDVTEDIDTWGDVDATERESDGIALSEPEEKGYYLSITGSYQENGVLSDVYATYELDSGEWSI